MTRSSQYLFMIAAFLLPLFSIGQELNPKGWDLYLLEDCAHSTGAESRFSDVDKLEQNQALTYFLQVLEFGVDPEVEARFFENLGHLRNGEDQVKWQGITERALKDFRESIKDRALYAITEIDDPAAVERLEDILGRQEASPFMQKSICEAIAKLKAR